MPLPHVPFQNQKEVWNLSASLFFYMIFKEKILLPLYSMNWSNFIVWLPLLHEILGNTCIVIVWPGCDVINFEINLIFLIKPYSSIWTKSQDKNLNILRTEGAFKMKLKASFINCKGLSLKQIKQILLEGESPILKNKILFFYAFLLPLKPAPAIFYQFFIFTKR